MASSAKSSKLSKKNRHRVGALTAGIAMSVFGLIVTVPSAHAADGDPYYSQVIASPGLTTQGITFDASGTMYIADTAMHSIDRVNSDGSTTPVLSGVAGIIDILADGDKGLYLADSNNSLLKYWDAATGTVSTLSNALATPHGMTWGPDGDIYIADSIDNRIAKWDPRTSTMSAAAYNLTYPSDVAVAPNGDMYVADTNNHRIAFVSASNPYSPQTLVGNVAYPIGVTLDQDGNLFFADLNNQLVEERNASTGAVSTVWHTSNHVYGLRFGPDGGLYMTDSSQVTELNPAGAPPVPRNVKATPGDSGITLTFDAPAYTGGTAITGYEVSVDGGSSWSPADLSGTGPYTATINDLINGTSYAVEVRADNANGAGTAATAASVVPNVAPAAPGELTAAAHGAGSIDLSFTAPVDNGSSKILGYQASVDGGVTFSPLTVDDSGTPITATVSGLAHGTSYAVQVRAMNVSGPGEAATANDADPTDVPSAPMAVAATPSDKSLAVEFQVPGSDGGLNITKYQASVDGGKTWADVVTTDGPSLDVLDTKVSGLTNGTAYTVQLRAVNVDGPGAVGTADPATPVGVSAAPTILGQVIENGSIQLSFSAPTDDGGSPVSYYQVSTDGGVTWNYAFPYQDDPLTINVSGLTNGTAYRLQLRALNDVGDGVAAIAPAATPSTQPGAPTGLTAVAGDKSATVSFTPPSDNGGASITGYEYTTNGGDTWLPLPLTIDVRRPDFSSRITAQLTGLVNGVEYTVQVRAVNVDGGGAASDAASLTPKSPVALKLDGAASRVVGAGTTVKLTGTVAPGSSVQIMQRLRGHSGYSLLKTVPGTAQGTFSVSFVANDDSTVYAQLGAARSNSESVQVAPTVAGPASTTVRKGSTVILRGTGVPSGSVLVHFHTPGKPASTDVVRSVAVAANGTWSRGVVATTAMVITVSSPTNGLSTGRYVVYIR